MFHLRAAALCGVLGFTIFAAGCSGGGGGATPSVPPIAQQPPAPASGSPSMQPSATTTSSSYDMHVVGPIVAIKSSTEFQMNGGSGIGYINVYITSSTVKGYGTLSPAVGVIANVYGNGSASTYVTATNIMLSTGSATPTPSPTGSAPAHVLTAGDIYAYGGTSTSVPVTSMSPYVNWALADPSYASTLRSHGIKVLIYMNFWRNYSSDNPAVGYDDIKPGGAHADAEAKTCSGSVIMDPSYGGGYINDAQSTTYATEHAQVVAQYRESEYGSNYDGLFADDTGSVWGIATPCGYTASAWMSSSNSIIQALGKPTIVNTLNAGSSQTSQIGYAGSSNTFGAMCEGCIAYWQSVSGVIKDYTVSLATWQNTEDAEAQMATEHKIFWLYSRAVENASTGIQMRNFVFASFLLSYDPNYSMLQEAFQTPSGFEIFPESGLVPEQPVTTETNVYYYQRSGGAYMREFGACYYRGVNQGRCAVVVNPSTSTETLPTTAYSHAMILSGYGVIDGGSVSFSASRPTSLPPESGIVLFP
jgi:hypothetical protein